MFAVTNEFCFFYDFGKQEQSTSHLFAAASLKVGLQNLQKGCISFHQQIKLN